MSNRMQQERYDHAKDMVLKMIIPKIYKLIFETPEFPYWFVFQCYFAIVLSTKMFENRRFRVIRSYISTILITFTPTITVDFLIGKELPIKESFKSFLIATALWATTSLFQTNLLKNFLSKSAIVFAPIHVFGTMRCLHYFNDSSREFGWTGCYVCGLLLSVSDILVAKIMCGNKTVFTSGSAFVRMIILFSLFFFLTEESPAMILFGILPYAPVGLALSIFFASMEFAVHSFDVFGAIEFVEPKQKTD